jgi:thymidylate kinase
MLRLIRRRVSDDPFIRVDWRVECLLLQAELVLASRVIVEPALASGKVVLYEHHADSIIAYQAARLVEDSVLAGIGKAVAATRALLSGFNVNRPDCVIYLQSNPAMASRRAEQRDNRLPTPKSAAFNRLVAQAYGSLYARATSDRVIRAAGPDDAIEHLRNLLAKAR